MQDGFLLSPAEFAFVFLYLLYHESILKFIYFSWLVVTKRFAVL